MRNFNQLSNILTSSKKKDNNFIVSKLKKVSKQQLNQTNDNEKDKNKHNKTKKKVVIKSSLDTPNWLEH